MLISNIKHALRSLLRNKVYSVINIAGLAVAVAFVILVVAYAMHALSMDTYADNTRNIYRVEMTDMWSASVNKPASSIFDKILVQSNEKNQVVMPVILAEDLKKNFKEISEVTRFAVGFAPVVRVNNVSFKENGNSVAEIDSNFFTMMGLPLLQGNVQHPFDTKQSAVLSESAAKKYFGKSNPIGQVISISEMDHQQYIVSAIAADFPSNSSLQFEVMVPIIGNPYYDRQVAQGTNSMSHITLFKLKEGTDIQQFQQQLNHFGKPYFESFVQEMQTFSDQLNTTGFRLSARPYREAHFNTSSPWPNFTDLKSLIQLILLAVIAIVIACVNYILLSLSRVAGRSQESGIRKTMGANTWHITKLFLSETFLLVAFSMIIGFLLAIIALPAFSQLSNVPLVPSLLFKPEALLILLGICFLLTVCAGIFPALKMAGISPLSMMRNFGTYKVNPTLSKVFLTLQYTTCTVLIVMAIVIAQQMTHLYNKDLGFDKEQVLLVQNPNRESIEQSMALRARMIEYAQQQPAFTDITTTGFRFAQGFQMNGFVINGKREYIFEMDVDFNYFSFSKIPIIQGRGFTNQLAIDTIRQNFPQESLDSNSSRTMSNIVVNETLYNQLGRPPLNEINKSMGSIIIGVCRNYDFMGAQQPTGPAYHVCRPKRPGYFWLRIGKQQPIASVIEKFQTFWNKTTNNEPFTYSFVDDDVKKVYESNERWMKIIRYSSWMAIFIACLGLFGLSAVTAISRTKEIGIRKVLGAGTFRLYLSLNKTSLALVGIAVLIAAPIANYAAQKWLEDFAYRISIHWTIYVLAGLITLLCAIVAISFHSIRTAHANPIESLKTE